MRVLICKCGEFFSPPFLQFDLTCKANIIYAYTLHYMRVCDASSHVLKVSLLYSKYLILFIMVVFSI